MKYEITPLVRSMLDSGGCLGALSKIKTLGDDAVVVHDSLLKLQLEEGAEAALQTAIDFMNEEEDPEIAGILDVLVNAMLCAGMPASVVQ